MENKITENKEEVPPPTTGQPEPVTRISNYEAAFEMTGHGLFNRLGLLGCSLIFVHSILEMVAIAYVITPAECDLRLTVLQKSMINSAIFIGIVKTAICWGTLSDRLGRRKIILPSVLGAVVASFFSSLCVSFWPMFIFRLITGYLISASSVTVLVYLGEIHTAAYRDKAISIAVAAVQCTFFLLPATAWIIIPGTWSFNLGPVLIRPWRVFMWTWSTLGLGGACILFMLPESPRFILAAKGPFATLPILAQMYAWNTKKPAAEYPVTAITTPSNILRSSNEGAKNILTDILQLLKPPMLRCYILSHVCMFMTFLITNGLYIWMPDFINEMLKDVSAGNSICDLINAKYISSGDSDDDEVVTDDCSDGEVNLFLYPTAMIMEFLYLIPFLTVSYFIDKRKKTLLYMYVMVTSAVGLALCCVIPQILIAMFCIIVGICGGCAVSILSALAAEIFPTSLRALAMCTMYMAGHIGAVVGTSLIGAMANFWCYILFFLIAFTSAGAALALVKYWPDIEVVRREMEAKNFTY